MALAFFAGSIAHAEVKIGVVGPLSGPQANSGLAMRQGYELAVADVNAKGGLTIDGKQQPVTLLFEDSASRPEMGVSASQKLLTRDGVDILIADSMASSVTLATMELAPSFGKFMASGQPVSIAIAQKIKDQPDRYANFWKLDWNSDAYAQTIYQSVSELLAEGKIKASKKTIAFIVEDTDYGKSNVEFTAPLFKNAGWKVVSNDAVANGSADFYPLLTKLRADEPDVLVSIFTSPNSGAALVKQLAEQDIRSLHLAVYYPVRPEFFPAAGKAADGLLWTPMSFDSAHNPEHKAFAEKVKAKIGVLGSGDHVYGYCEMAVLLDNVQKAGSLEPSKISAAFAKTDYKCAYGHWVFDTETHSPKVGPDFIPVPVAQIWNGDSQVVWPKSAATAEFKAKP
jgi:branched-chain amino acid transport system substrate-binding protein